MNFCYLNGRIIPLTKASINIYDIGFLRGYAVFDYIKAYEGKPFQLKEHLDRLNHSAKRHGLKVPLSQSKIAEIIAQLIKKNKATTCAIRLVLTGGVSSSLEHNKKAPTFAILIEEAHPLPAVLYKKGAAVITAEFERAVWDAKHTNYSFAVSMQDARKKAKAIEIFYTWKDEVREATTSNIFIVKNNTVITPKENVLFGITRNCVIDLARQEFTIEERKITLQELLAADECFITASNKEVLPIVKVDTTVIGTGTVGPVTSRIMELFKDKISHQ